MCCGILAKARVVAVVVAVVVIDGERDWDGLRCDLVVRCGCSRRIDLSPGSNLGGGSHWYAKRGEDGGYSGVSGE